MNSFDFILAQQRDNINELQKQCLDAQMAIVTAAGLAIKGQEQAALKLIIETAEALGNETESGNTSQLAGNDSLGT